MSALASQLARPAPPGGVAREMGVLADGIERFCSDSLSLARLELGEGARSMAVDLARVSVFALLSGLGYGLLSVALAVWLSASIGAVAAFFAVGVANALVGALGLKVVLGRVLADSRGHLERPEPGGAP